MATKYTINAGTFTELYTEFNGETVTLIKWLAEDIARVRTHWGLELDLHSDELTPALTDHDQWRQKP